MGRSGVLTWLVWVGVLGCARAPVPVSGSRGVPIEEMSSSELEELEAAQEELARAREPREPLEPLPGPPRATNFLVLGGGGEPSNNEIALEKNVRYFQRTLEALGRSPASATIYFANGNDGQATVRYLGEGRRERYKAPEIPHLGGPATLERFLEWVERSARDVPAEPVFIYFTGHGSLNSRHPHNSHLSLWEDDMLTVRAFGLFLGRLPRSTPVVAVMSQCYSGAFAHFIHQDAHPKRPVLAQPRCGFFATVESLPSVGCTPETDEADYRDYSSSFFAGLSGVGRTGKEVGSADHDGDGRVSYAEAHAFAKVDAETTDLPVSTSEAWLQRRASVWDRRRIFREPIGELMRAGRPEQRYVVESLVGRLGFTPELSWNDNLHAVKLGTEEVWVAQAQRLRMELLNIGMQEKLRASGSAWARSVLERLLQCEAGSWDVPPGAREGGTR
jgi:hypothetical protein